MVLTNEDQSTTNQILLEYLKDIDTSLAIAPSTLNSNATTYWIGNAGNYFVKGLMNDPLNLFLVYLFTTDKSVEQGTFGVFKIDFSFPTPKYIYSVLSMSSGLSFSVNCIVRTSLTDGNDFYFAGKAQSLTDGTIT